MAVALLAGPSPALAQYVNSTPSISGTAQVGKTLTASGGNNAGGPHGTIVAYVWMRCDNNTTYARGCTLLKDRNETNYVLAQADRNAYMRVARVALKWWQPWVGWSLNDVAHRVSGATKRVAAAPVATPTPTPTPVTTPTPTPTPVATPVKTPTATATVTPEPTVVPPPSFDTGAEPAPAVEPAAQPDPPAAQPPATDVRGAADTKPAKMLKPFPVVRISGRLTTGGANIQVLSVKAPKGAKVSVNCLGKGCPRKAVDRATKSRVVRITPFQRVLPAGVKLRISISKPGYISKVTTIAIRKGKAPLRSDQCRMPGAKKLIRCPK